MSGSSLSNGPVAPTEVVEIKSQFELEFRRISVPRTEAERLTLDSFLPSGDGRALPAPRIPRSHLLPELEGHEADSSGEHRGAGDGTAKRRAAAEAVCESPKRTRS